MSSDSPETLNDRHRLMAYMVASGKTNVEIATRLNCGANRISKIKSSSLFKMLVNELRREIAERVVEQTADLATTFDRGAPRMAEELYNLGIGAEMENVQLGAIKDWLDRAPSAPKARKVVEMDQRGVVLQISAAAFENMVDAAQEVGEPIDVEFQVTEDEFEDHFE